MPDKEKVRLLWEQVRKETDLTQAVKMIADLGEQAVLERMQENSDLRDVIRKLDVEVRGDFRAVQRALFGNGDPTHSVIARLERIEEKQCKASESANKVAWIVISAVVVQIILYLLKVL